MKDEVIGQRTYVAPVGALPDDPAQVIGLTEADAPPEVVAYYAAFGWNIITLTQWRMDADDYVYDVLIVNLAGTDYWRRTGGVFQGVVHDVTGVVGLPGGGILPFSTFDVGTFEASILRVADGSLFHVESTLANSTVKIDANTLVTYAGQSIVQFTGWSPVVTQAAVNPTAGFETFDNPRYTKQGDLCHVRLRMEVADATKVGTGAYSWTLPFGTLLNDQQLVGVALDASAGLRYPCVAIVNAATDTVNLFGPSGAAVTQASPFAVANGDRYEFQGQYYTDP